MKLLKQVSFFHFAIGVVVIIIINVNGHKEVGRHLVNFKNGVENLMSEHQKRFSELSEMITKLKLDNQTDMEIESFLTILALETVNDHYKKLIRDISEICSFDSKIYKQFIDEKSTFTQHLESLNESIRNTLDVQINNRSGEFVSNNLGILLPGMQKTFNQKAATELDKLIDSHIKSDLPKYLNYLSQIIVGTVKVVSKANAEINENKHIMTNVFDTFVLNLQENLILMAERNREKLKAGIVVKEKEIEATKYMLNTPWLWRDKKNAKKAISKMEEQMQILNQFLNNTSSYIKWIQDVKLNFLKIYDSVAQDLKTMENSLELENKRKWIDDTKHLLSENFMRNRTSFLEKIYERLTDKIEEVYEIGCSISLISSSNS